MSCGIGGAQDATRRFDTVDLRHPDIHQDDVRIEASGQRHGLGAGGGLSCDPDAVVCVEESGESGSHHRLVVGDEDADGHGVSSR